MCTSGFKSQFDPKGKTPSRVLGPKITIYLITLLLNVSLISHIISFVIGFISSLLHLLGRGSSFGLCHCLYFVPEGLFYQMVTKPWCYSLLLCTVTTIKEICVVVKPHDCQLVIDCLLCCFCFLLNGWLDLPHELSVYFVCVNDFSVVFSNTSETRSTRLSF